MRDKIEAYIEELFKKAPNTPQTRDLKEEILGNTLDKYDEQISSGKDEEHAYQNAISGIGDVDELIKEYSEDSGEVTISEQTPIATDVPEAGNELKPSMQKILTAIMWCLTIIAYFIISLITGAWAFTWVTFLIGFALKFVIDGIFELIDSKK